MADLNPLLTSLATGRFNRATLREALDGLRISDVIGARESEFVASLTQKDQLIGRVFWRALTPVFDAYRNYDSFRDIRAEINKAKVAMQRAICAISAGQENPNPNQNQAQGAPNT
jgi:hypothetical protein